MAWLSGELFSVGGMEPGVKVNLEETSWFKRAGIDLLWGAMEANTFANEWIPLTCKFATGYCALVSFRGEILRKAVYFFATINVTS